MEYQLNVSQQDIQIILSALSELPLKITLNTFLNLRSQIQEQDKQNTVTLE